MNSTFGQGKKEKSPPKENTRALAQDSYRLVAQESVRSPSNRSSFIFQRQPLGPESFSGFVNKPDSSQFLSLPPNQLEIPVGTEATPSANEEEAMGSKLSKKRISRIFNIPKDKETVESIFNLGKRSQKKPAFLISEDEKAVNINLQKMIREKEERNNRTNLRSFDAFVQTIKKEEEEAISTVIRPKVKIEKIHTLRGCKIM